MHYCNSYVCTHRASDKSGKHAVMISRSSGVAVEPRAASCLYLPEAAGVATCTV